MGAVGADAGCDACRFVDSGWLRQSTATARNEQDLNHCHSPDRRLRRIRAAAGPDMAAREMASAV
jgi:hypothetical protein